MRMFVFESLGNPPKLYTQAVKAYDRARVYIDDENKKAQALNPTGKAPSEFYGVEDYVGFLDIPSYELTHQIEQAGERYVKLYSVKRSDKVFQGTETEVGSVWLTTCKFAGETIEEAF